MSRNYLYNLFSLLFKPEEAWKTFAQFPKGYLGYTYCSLFLVMLSHFLHFLFIDTEQNARMAIFAAILSLFALGCGLFCSIIFVRFIYQHLEQQTLPYSKALAFTTYASICIYLLAIIGPFIPSIFQILALGTLGIIWTGAEPFLAVSKENKMAFSIQATLVLLVVYYGILGLLALLA